MKRLLLIAFASLIWTSAHAGQYNPEFTACRQDFEKHCFHVEEGGKRQLKCLYDIRHKIAPDCARIVKQRYRRHLQQSSQQPANPVR